MKSLSMIFLAANFVLAQPAMGAEEKGRRDDAEARKEMQDARRELAEAARRVAELSHELGEGFAWHVRGPDAPFARRAMLGVNIGDADKSGVEVLSVSPGGPAEKAGLQAGDRIVAIEETDLLKAERPARALLKAMAEVEPGSEVKVEYQREGERRSAIVKTEEMQRALRFLTRDDLPGAPFPPGFLHLAHGWGDMELVALSKELGEYFGTDKGLLVVRAPGADVLKLRDGDVIQAIGGREPQDVGHAIRILRSYQPGEKVKIDIVRKRKKMSLDVEMPDRRTGMLPLIERDIRFMRAPEDFRHSR